MTERERQLERTVERLRERLLDDDGPVLLELREAISTEMEAYAFRDGEGEEVLANDPNVEALGNDVSDQVKAKLAAVLPAAFPPPSDSQGDQERCERCHGTGWSREGSGFVGKCSPCPDCNTAPTRCPSCGSTARPSGYCSNAWHKQNHPAPTQVEQDPTAGLPPELAKALRDPTIIIDRDREIKLADGKTLAEHLEEWRNAPSNTVSADPSLIAAPTQVEGDDFHLCFNCGAVTHAGEWTYWQPDPDHEHGEAEYRPDGLPGDSDGLAKCPRCGQLHGDCYQGAGYEDGTKAHLEGEKKHLLAKDPEFFVGSGEQPEGGAQALLDRFKDVPSVDPRQFRADLEGGDEEDWPDKADLIRFEGDAPDELRVLPAVLEGRDTDLDGRKFETRRYLLSASQDSSGLEEKLQRAQDQIGDLAARLSAAEEDRDEARSALLKATSEVPALNDRTTKAEAERDEFGRQLADAEREAAKQRTFTAKAGERAKRAEAALEELAAEFERRAEDYMCRYSLKPEVPEWMKARATANRKAALEAREKAAKLKEGER